MKIKVDSAALAAVAHEIEHGCFMLGFVNDEEDIDDVHYFAAQIRRAAVDLRRIIKDAKPAEPESKEQPDKRGAAEKIRGNLRKGG